MEREKSLRDYNFQCALEVCSGSARDDHYNGKHGLYRLAAYKKIDPKIPFADYMNQVTELFHKLKNLDIPPSCIDISNMGDMDWLEVSWMATDYQVISSRSQYAGLIIEFSKYLEDLGLDFKIQTGMFNDDPVDIRDIMEVNCFPSFNSECFGSRLPLEITCNWFIGFSQFDYYNR